jgi:hypothetical protein
MCGNNILNIQFPASFLHLPPASTRRITLHIFCPLTIHNLDIDRLAAVEDVEGSLL